MRTTKCCRRAEAQDDNNGISVELAMHLISKKLSTHYLKPKSIMANTMHNLYIQLKDAQDAVFMTAPMFDLNGMGTQTMYVSTSVLMHKVYNNCLHNIIRYSKRAIMVGGAAMIVSNPQCVFYPAYFLQNIIHTLNNMYRI